jgi:hypothetical protein
MPRTCSRGMGKKNAYGILVGKPEGKRPLGKARRKWEDNLKTDLRKRGRGAVDWIDLAKDRDRRRTLLNTVTNLRVPQSIGTFLSNRATGSFSRRAQLHMLTPAVNCVTSQGSGRQFQNLWPLLFSHCVYLFMAYLMTVSKTHIRQN